MPESPLYKAAKVFLDNLSAEEIEANADLTNLRFAVGVEAMAERARRVLSKTESGKLAFERTGEAKDRVAFTSLAFGTENEKRVVMPDEVFEVYMDGPWVVCTVRKR